MSSINELICDELIYWKFEISSTAQSKNQLNWASCGLDQSIETIQSMGSINNQSTDRYSRWGPPACSNVLAGWASLILPAWRPPQPPCPPAPSTGSLSLLFFAASLGGRCAARTLFFRTLNLHTVNWKRARSPIAPTCEPQVRGDAWFFASGHLSFVLNPSRRQQPGKIFLSFYFKIFVNSFRSRMVLHAWWGTIGAG